MSYLKTILINPQSERYFLFFINVYIFLIYGVLSGSYGITMNQFGQILDLKTTDLSLGLSAQAIFGCVASLIATYTLDRWNRNLQYAIDVFLLSIVIILFPFANSTAEYLFYSSAIGFFTSVINCVNTIWVLELFRESPSFYIQMLFFFYPLGSTLSRLLFSPFLDNSSLIAHNNTLSSYSILNGTSATGSDTQYSNPRFLGFFSHLFDNVQKCYIWIPYLVVAILMMLGSFMIFFIHFYNPFVKQSNKEATTEPNNNDVVVDHLDDHVETEPAPFKRGDSIRRSIKHAIIKSGSFKNYSFRNDTIKNRELKLKQQEEIMAIPPGRSERCHKILSYVFVVLVCIIVTLQVGCEINFVNFIPTYLTKLSSFNFDDTESSYISMILTGFVTFGRFVNIFLSLKIDTEFMIYINFTMMLGGNLILIFLSNHSVEFLWTGIGLIGLGFSSTYPLIIAFVEKRYLMTNSLSSLLEFSCLFFVCFSPIVLGHILDNIPDYFIYITTVISGILLIMFCSLHLLGSFRKA